MKRCFIENDFRISTDLEEDFIEDFGIPIKKAFNIVVCSAFENHKKVVDAILKSDEIWLMSAFIGDSEKLFTNMLRMAKTTNLKNKTIVNLFQYKDVAWHLTDEQRAIIKELKQNNIKFIYKDCDEFDNIIKQLKF